MDDSDDNHGPTEQDRQIWRDYIDESQTEEVEDDFETLLDKQEAFKDEQVCTQQQEEKQSLPPSPALIKGRKGDYQLDKRTEERLKKGKMPIEARLDLHGFNRAQAHDRLNQFLNECYRKNLRCVLVITGKGKANATSADWLTPSKGILKEHVPIWLGEGFLKTIVLKFSSAQPKDGGSGALYVYLKKNR